MKTAWWNASTRVIQTNLQVKDTDRIEPDHLANSLQKLGAKVLVFNVGGIYAWYDSQVPYHHVNEYLPPDQDLLEQVIAACHARGIKFVGRFDFSKASDEIYLARPDWFSRNPDLSPQTIGETRPGNWSLLYLTCMSSGYRNEAVAAPILKEAVSRYDMDAVFFNAPFPNDCWCDRCRQRYETRYGQAMPDDPKLFPADWQTVQIRDNILILNEAIHAADPNLPTILYYWDDQLQLSDKLSPLICDESQNILSRGTKNLSPSWLPSWNMKKCLQVESEGPPFGIIHSSPGMDWRHTGIPAAEYEFWLSQIPAAGGSLWHSLTGLPTTIRDKKILAVAQDVNAKAAQAEPWLKEAWPRPQAGLLWQSGQDSSGWLKAFYDGQIPFSLIRPETISAQTLRQNPVQLVPAAFELTAEHIEMLKDYVQNGGRLILEGALQQNESLSELCGIETDTSCSEPLRAAYLRVEDQGAFLASGSIEGNRLLAFAGSVAYSQPTTAQTLATLVPPFAPLEAVGAPPERASLPLPQTDIPLCLKNRLGKGDVMYLPFSLNDLIKDFGLADHVELAINLILHLSGPTLFSLGHQPGILLHVYETPDRYLLQIINGIGSRPLNRITPCQLTVRSRLKNSGAIHDVFAQTKLSQRVTDNGIAFDLPLPDAWRLIAVDKT